MQYSDLPIFKSTYDLTLEMYMLVRGFNKEFKYVLGEQLKKETTELAILIYKANSKKDKREALENAREKLETVRLLVRLAKDLKIISLRAFVRVSKNIQDTSKQILGWQRSCIATV